MLRVLMSTLLMIALDWSQFHTVEHALIEECCICFLSIIIVDLVTTGDQQTGIWEMSPTFLPCAKAIVPEL